jgi:hypothetical protein
VFPAQVSAACALPPMSARTAIITSPGAIEVIAFIVRVFIVLICSVIDVNNDQAKYIAVDVAKLGVTIASLAWFLRYVVISFGI